MENLANVTLSVKEALKFVLQGLWIQPSNEHFSLLF